MAWGVECGDMRSVLATLPENSMDSCPCDPPYELGFMGKKWDSTGIAFNPEAWAAVYRVLKPGAYLAAFGGTRTWHRIAVAIEDAGFEIRDSLAWLYGQGFPKSLNISKQLDKERRDDVRHVCRFLRSAMDEKGVTSAKLAEHFGCHSRLIDHWAARDTDSQPSLPTPEQWRALKQLLALPPEMDAEVARLNARKGEPGDAYKEAEVVGEHEGETPGLVGVRFSKEDSFIRGPNSALARLWEGWGTALKPSFEPIVLARKPLDGTAANNVAKWGTGGLNIDGCRVPHSSPADLAKHQAMVDGLRKRGALGNSWKNSSPLENCSDANASGRWPPNVCVDYLVANDLDLVFGTHKAGKSVTRNGKGGKIFNGKGNNGAARPDSGYSDIGGVSRYFYCPKANGEERDAGLEAWPVLTGGQMTDREEGAPGATNPRSGAGRGGDRRNPHPTVKPLELMRWLCRLITPPGGWVLDPFAGSGTTGCAAVLEGFNFAGVELDPTHHKLCVDRIAHWAGMREAA